MKTGRVPTGEYDIVVSLGTDTVIVKNGAQYVLAGAGVRSTPSGGGDGGGGGGQGGPFQGQQPGGMGYVSGDIETLYRVSGGGGGGGSGAGGFGAGADEGKGFGAGVPYGFGPCSGGGGWDPTNIECPDYDAGLANWFLTGDAPGVPGVNEIYPLNSTGILVIRYTGIPPEFTIPQ